MRTPSEWNVPEMPCSYRIPLHFQRFSHTHTHTTSLGTHPHATNAKTRRPRPRRYVELRSAGTAIAKEDEDNRCEVARDCGISSPTCTYLPTSDRHHHTRPIRKICGGYPADRELALESAAGDTNPGPRFARAADLPSQMPERRGARGDRLPGSHLTVTYSYSWRRPTVLAGGTNAIKAKREARNCRTAARWSSPVRFPG